MGGDNVEYILGKVGQSDVLDCVTAINSTLEKYPSLDPQKVNLSGGSHGGFLNAHLSGQYPVRINSFPCIVYNKIGYYHHGPDSESVRMNCE